MDHRASLVSVPSLPPAAPGASSAPPLIVLSNRGPYAQREVEGNVVWTRTVGGLVSALDPVVRSRAGVWIHGGEPEAAVAPREVTGYEVAPVVLSADETEGFYRRVANGVLWPLLHSFPSRVRTQGAPWGVYRDVNRRFAAAAAAACAGGEATFWAQDFHMLLVPRELRALRPSSRIGWFNHIPWPAPEVFATLPERADVLSGLLGADLLGFQTARDARNFLAAVQELTTFPVDLDAGHVGVAGRTVRVGAFPIGIDVDTVDGFATDPEVHAERERLRGRFGGVRVLLSVDRLDYTKGMPERLLAFCDMLERHAELHQRVALVQVAVPSRTEVEQYAALKREVDELVGQINGRFARPGWTPVHYLYRSFDLRTLVALYQLADVAVVTPLRDGMNLVAHEFAAARTDRAGVLVLSEFAGAATILDGALHANPYDHPRTADSLVQALEMPRAEQTARMDRLREAVVQHRIARWQQRYLAALESRGVTAGLRAVDARGSYAPAEASGRFPRAL